MYNVYVQQTVQPSPPPRPVSNLSRVRVICVHSELNEIIIIIAEGGGEGGGAESMGCFYKPINTSFIRLSPMLSLLFISLDIQIMEQSSLKCNYAGRNSS